MLNYRDADRNRILRAMEDDILAIVAIDLSDDSFEVVYSDGAYRDYDEHRFGSDFFNSWLKKGGPLLFEPDRARMAAEIGKENLAARLADQPEFITTCRFVIDEVPVRCRIKAAKDVLEPGTIVLSIRRLCQTETKHLFIRMFGIFSVLKDGRPVALRGKAKEILALVATARGKEMSNSEIYRTIWENRTCSNRDMTVYYNALGRLKRALAQEGLSDLLLSTPHGQMVDTRLFDCDYYDWLDGRADPQSAFEGEFLPEYSWGEYILGKLVRESR